MSTNYSTFNQPVTEEKRKEYLDEAMQILRRSLSRNKKKVEISNKDYNEFYSIPHAIRLEAYKLVYKEKGMV